MNHVILEKFERHGDYYIFIDSCSAKSYRVNSATILPSVISMVDGKLERPTPIRTWLWSNIITVPLLFLTMVFTALEMKYMFGGIMVIWLAISLHTLVCNIIFGKHWSNITVREM